MSDNEWGPNSRRRKRNQIDIFNWSRFIKEQARRFWSAPGGPYYLSVSLIVILVGVFSLFDISTTAGKIHSGVQIAGFDVGGLSQEEAVSAIKKRTRSNIKKNIQIEYENENAELAPTQLNLTIYYRQSVRNAFDYGRSDNFLKNTANRILSRFRTADLRPDYKLSEKQLNDFLHNLGGEKHKPAVNATIRILNEKPKLIKSREGFGANSDKAAFKIISAVLNPQKVTLEAEKLYPEVTEKNGEKALGDARRIISSPVLLRSGTKKWSVSREKLISLFEAEVKDKKLEASLNKDKTIEYLESFTNVLNKEPKNAKFAVNGTKASVIPSTDGVKVDDAATFIAVQNTALKTDNRIVNISVKNKKPTRTTEQAKKMGIKEMVSTFSTYYPAGKPRVKNIHRLAEVLDGMMIAPGETFSFNGRVGERTADRGFVAAPEIREGELVETIGGGICQVSTTVFNTALLEGFPIGERSPHSLFIKKYPPGRDAAVSYTKPDLTFTNDTKTWILIKGGYTGTSISISFYGTDYGRDVSFTTKMLGTIPFPTKEVKDATLKKGKREEEKAGVVGRRYHVVRIVTVNGKEIRRTNIHSTFNPEPRVVRVGTKLTRAEIEKLRAEKKKN